MRFVSKFPRLGLGTVIKEKFVLALDGQRDQVGESVSVMFSQDGLMATDVKAALEKWSDREFTGRWLDADGVTLQPITERIGMFDTEQQGWDDELREKVEAWMLAKGNYGLDFIKVEPVAAQAPWPTYDKTHHFRIPALAEELGCVEEAIEYERANKNRESIIAGLEEKLKAAPAAPAEDVVLA